MKKSEEILKELIEQITAGNLENAQHILETALSDVFDNGAGYDNFTAWDIEGYDYPGFIW